MSQTQTKTSRSSGSDRQKTSKAQAWKNFIQVAGILPILVAICVIFSLVTPNFLSLGNLINVIRQASINIVLATGMTFVILTGGIDLSVGSILGVTAVVGVLVSLFPGLGWFAVPAALIAGVFLGLLNGSLVAYLGLPPFIVTLGSYTALRGVAYLVANGTTVINRNLNFAWVGNNYVGPIPWLVIIAFLAVLASWFVLRRTVLGRHIYAVGGNIRAARLTGIKVSRVLLFVYGVSGLLSGLGGIMSASRLYSATGMLGQGYELDAIAAVILEEQASRVALELFGGLSSVP